MRFYIAIDDTDNSGDGAENRGTGARARELAVLLTQASSGRNAGVTRHQLLVDPAIPYTSHNSTACIVVKVDRSRASDPATVVARLAELAGAYLEDVAAPGSDAGLCVAAKPQVGEEIMAWGRRAQREVLTAEAAHRLAHSAGIHLSGHTGTRIGVIGALAAVGLRHGGADGRFLDLPGLRDLSDREPVSGLQAVGVAGFQANGAQVALSPDTVVEVGQTWPQPILTDGQPTLLVEQFSDADGALCWRACPREIVKQY